MLMLATFSSGIYTWESFDIKRAPGRLAGHLLFRPVVELAPHPKSRRFRLHVLPSKESTVGFYSKCPFLSPYRYPFLLQVIPFFPVSASALKYVFINLGKFIFKLS